MKKFWRAFSQILHNVVWLNLFSTIRFPPDTLDMNQIESQKWSLSHMACEDNNFSWKDEWFLLNLWLCIWKLVYPCLIASFLVIVTLNLLMVFLALIQFMKINADGYIVISIILNLSHADILQPHVNQNVSRYFPPLETVHFAR